jgi:hypothetical protein
VTEAQLQAEVLALAQGLGLLVFHSTDSRRDVGPGFPDLIVLGSALLAAETKSETGELSPDQRRWKWRLLAAGCRWVLWRPSDWHSGIIETTLREIT